jgi:hypothetical protein
VPASTPNIGKQWFEVADGKKHITFQEQAGTRKDGIPEIPGERAKRVFF